MLRRALPICLTDPKSARAGGKRILFDVMSSEESHSVGILFRPLLLMANAIRCGEELLAKLSMRGPFEPSRARGATRTRFRLIDWDRTAESFGSGVRQVFFTEPSAQLTPEEVMLLALTVTEFLGHCTMLIEAFTNRRICRQTTALDDMIELVRNRWVSLQRLSDDTFQALRKQRALAQRLLRPPLETLADAIRRVLREEPNASESDYWTAYLVQSHKQFEGPWHGIRHARWLLDWRRSYTNLASGFGFGAHLSLPQLRDPAHVYELWCFSELADILVKAGRRNILQRYALRGKNTESLFQDDHGLQIYYNWFGREVTPTVRSHLLPRAHVEWYISGNGDREGVILDTKYKELSSRDVLTVMGYMVNFGVTRGVVVSKMAVDSRLVHGEVVTDGLICGRLAGLGHGSLYAMTLVPNPRAMTENISRLTALATRLGLRTGHP